MIEKALFSRRRWCLGLATCFSAGMAASVALAQSPVTMRIGFLRNYVPFSYLDDKGQLQGFDVDVMRATCQAMGWQCVPVAESMPKLRHLLDSREIDLIGNQVLATPENRRMFDLVRPSYASLQLSAVQHEDDERDFLSLEDLVGRKLGVLAHSGVEEQARGVLGSGVRAFERIEQAMVELADKKLDMVLEENLIADYYIEKDRLPLKVTAPFAAPIAAGLAVRKGDEAMRQRWSQALVQMLKQGDLVAISSRWFGYDVSRSRASY